MYKINWSPLARDSYLHILNYLMEEWSLDVAIAFDEKADGLIEKLKKHKYLCPAAKNRRFRRCVINKHTSLVYEVAGDTINLIAFYDNRSSIEF